MTSVGKTSGDVGAAASKLLRQGEAQPQSQGNVARGRHQNPADSLYALTRFSNESEFGLSANADSDEAQFLKSFNAAVKRDAENGDGGDESQQKEPASEQRVIGFAERLNWTGLPTAATVQQNTAEEPHSKALVDTITQLMTKAISADAAPQAGQATRYRFALPDGNAGLSHIQIVMTSSTLDVVLERHGAAAGEDLAAAATALAERLLTRFSKRTVRVIESFSNEPKSEPGDQADASERPIPLLRS